MEKKDIKTMPVLTQKALENSKGVFIVDKDYNLDNSKLVVPRGMTIKFEKGSLNNGTLVLDDSLLDNMKKGSISARIEGTIRNTTIHTADIGGIDYLGVDLSGKTIYCDLNNDVVNHEIILNNTNTTLTTTFDGTNTSIICNVSLFKIYGQSNIIIKNFNAIANASGIVFEEMITTAANVTGVQILDNIMDGFMIGISLNNDSANYTVSNCTVSGNHVYNCPGTTSGSGYGIHLANARNCTISGNEVVNCERHAIYHAYGENNTISNNVIRNHCQNITSYNLLAALEIGRKSKHITVTGNNFVNCNNICLLIYSPLPTNDGDGTTHLFRYGKCEDIVVQNNNFYKGSLTGSIGNLPFIYIGVEGTPYSTLSTYGMVVADVKILNNTFQKFGGANQKCFKIHQCEELTISGNTFQLGLPSSSTDVFLVIEIPTGYISGNDSDITIKLNTFNYLTSGVSNLYLIGENMSMIDSTVNPNFTIEWSSNTLQNQIIGGNTMYQIYNPNYPPGNNFTIS